MNDPFAQRPEPGEYAPFYAPYLAAMPDGSVLHALREQIDDTLALLGGLDERQAEHRYTPGKWSVKEVVGHLADSERVFGYRALRIARGDATPLAGFEQEDYVRNASFGRRSLGDLANDFRLLRESNLRLFESFDAPALDRRGVANGMDVSVRALVWITAGHERHHVRILRERYLEEEAGGE